VGEYNSTVHLDGIVKKEEKSFCILEEGSRDDDEATLLDAVWQEKGAANRRSPYKIVLFLEEEKEDWGGELWSSQRKGSAPVAPARTAMTCNDGKKTNFLKNKGDTHNPAWEKGFAGTGGKTRSGGGLQFGLRD